jgi:uroporphyrinogen-III synthase
MGGVPLVFPLLDISPVSNTHALNEQISRLDRFNLAIFISPNAVRYGVAAIRAVREVPVQLRIATVGSGSAAALSALGIKEVIVPKDRFDSEGLLAVPELRDVAGWKVLIFRGDVGRELLGDTLRARGATVEYATCYRRSKPQQNMGALLAEGADAIILTSSEAFGNLWQMLDDEGRSRLRRMPVFVPHERIAEAARHKGCSCVRLTASGDDGIIDSLTKWASAGDNK